MTNIHPKNDSGNIGTNFKLGILLNVAFIALEIVFGILSNSMALLSDAGHNFSDVIALGFSWIAINLSGRKPTLKFTYGFRRSTILAAILNTMILLAATLIILWETIQRFGKPDQVNSVNIIIVASIGILINGFTAWLFIKGKKHDLNIKSAFTHFLADTLVSLGVVISGIIIYFTGFYLIDSIISIVIIVVILYSSYKLLIDSISLVLDAVPESVNIYDVQQYLDSIPEVDSIHDLHIWALGTNSIALTVHLETNLQTDMLFILKIQNDLKEKFKIGHSTIQVEFGGTSELCNNCD